MLPRVRDEALQDQGPAAVKNENEKVIRVVWSGVVKLTRSKVLFVINVLQIIIIFFKE